MARAGTTSAGPGGFTQPGSIVRLKFNNFMQVGPAPDLSFDPINYFPSIPIRSS
jgi:hypothetical protein